MPPVSLADFIEQLAEAGELRRIDVEVDPELEIGAVSQRADRAGPALLFTQVRGHHPPVVTNLLDSEARLCRALGVGALEELAERLAPRPAAGGGWLDRLTPGAFFSPASNQAAKRVRHAACQQVVKLGRDVDLNEWPALRCWPQEPRRSITAGRLSCRNPASDCHAVEDPPLEIIDRSTLGIAWRRHHRGWRALQAHRLSGEPMPVAVWLGGAPGFAVVCAAALPEEVDGYAFASLLCGGAIELVKCRTHDLDVPADAEIVLEGFVDATETPLPSGPLGAFDGHYGPPGEIWPLRVSTVTHRANPLFPAVAPGPPPNQATLVARALCRLWLPQVKAAIPELVDYCLPDAAGPKSLAFLSIRKSWPQQARKVAAAFWGLEAFMHTKVLIIVDEQVDVRDAAQVALHAGANAHPGRDLFFHRGPAWPLDHAASGLLSNAVGIDATAKLPEEHGGPWPARLTPSPEIIELVEKRWAEY